MASGWDDEDYDDPPFADPQIRVEYEAALGRLILAHNEVDHRLPKALQRVVLRVSGDGSLNAFATGSFAQRLANLELLQKATTDLGATMVDVVELRRLNAIRNNVAHGHFDQNPFDGSFELVGNGRGTQKRTRYQTSELESATAALLAIASTLHAHEVFGDFPPIYDLPEGASPA